MKTKNGCSEINKSKEDVLDVIFEESVFPEYISDVVALPIKHGPGYFEKGGDESSNAGVKALFKRKPRKNIKVRSDLDGSKKWDARK